MSNEAPSVEDLNAMSGFCLALVLLGMPRAERNALLNQMDDAAVRRFVHAAIGLHLRRIGRLLLWVGTIAAVVWLIYSLPL